MTSSGPEPGWYFDPGDRTCERYWNGAIWTEHSRPAPTAAPPPDPYAADPFAPAPSTAAPSAPDSATTHVVPIPAAPVTEPSEPEHISHNGPPVYTVAAYADARPEPIPVPTPQDWSTTFRVGSWAQVVVGDKRYLGRVGEIAAIDGSNKHVDLRFKGSLGTYSFRYDHLAIINHGPPQPMYAPPPAAAGGFQVGGWARVVVGDKRYLGRVGKIVSVDRDGDVWLKFKGSFGAFSFPADHLVAVPGVD